MVPFSASFYVSGGKNITKQSIGLIKAEDPTEVSRVPHLYLIYANLFKQQSSDIEGLDE